MGLPDGGDRLVHPRNHWLAPRNPLSRRESIAFIERAVAARGIARQTLTLNTDNGSAFTARAFKQTRLLSWIARFRFVTTEPLGERLEVCGPPRALTSRARASPTCPDAATHPRVRASGSARRTGRSARASSKPRSGSSADGGGAPPRSRQQRGADFAPGVRRRRRCRASARRKRRRRARRGRAAAAVARHWRSRPRSPSSGSRRARRLSRSRATASTSDSSTPAAGSLFAPASATLSCGWSR